MEYIKTNDECCTFIVIYNITNFVWKKKKNVHFPFCTQFVQSSKRELKLFFDFTYSLQHNSKHTPIKITTLDPSKNSIFNT